jgi:hypothetical protein
MGKHRPNEQSDESVDPFVKLINEVVEKNFIKKITVGQDIDHPQNVKPRVDRL